ncbi:MAG: ParB-like protein [Xanthobacteraceae bacterium]
MTIVREPLIAAVAIGDLRPTQITVGMREVATKRKRWRELGAKKDEKFLGKHIIPVVLGPKQRPYVVDHHHLARALHDEGVKEVAITVGNNLSGLDREAFWTVMDNRDWMHPYDAEGVRRPYRDIPKTVAELIDDPFRSLAGELRRAGGFAKDTTPFSEFLWADFLRRRVKRKLIEQDFDHAVEVALELAKSQEAGYLPGWCGPSPGA